MNIKELMRLIGLQPELQASILDFCHSFSFDLIAQPLKDIYIYDRMQQAYTEIQNILGDDPGHMKMLGCMLKASADAYSVYRELGIDDAIYVATMGCYTRFLKETFEISGTLDFDRYWWTTRQAGCHLFRIGALEYERKCLESDTVIAIHIPSDADLSPKAVEQSFEMARAFCDKIFPALSGRPFQCHSWLLDPQLKNMLSNQSNILNFQTRFEIYNPGEISSEFIAWLYKRNPDTDLAKLPENTSLQRNVKKHLLSGGVIRNAYGITMG